MVRGWPAEPSEGANGDATISSNPSGSGNNSADVIWTLLAEGLLTEDESIGKEVSPATVPIVSTTIDHVRGRFPKIDWQDLRNFTTAWALTTFHLKTLPLIYIIRRIQQRKTRHLDQGAAFDVQKAHRLMTAYFVIRPNFFSERDACLRDSLTFLEFVARYDMYPTLVFGVTMQPFAAHAWVQEGPMVLNDYIPHVNRFKPIMAI